VQGPPGGVRRGETPASADSGVNSAMELDELIERNPEKMGGVAVFTGTRVPVEFLFQFLEDDQTLETFLDQFPTVSRAQARGVLGASRDLLLRSRP
jgi:uncharacterized protein (DUF433 family)